MTTEPSTELGLSTRDRLVQDQGRAELQLRGVVRQLDETQVTQQALFRQKLALETLVNYLKTVLQDNALTDFTERKADV